MSATAQPARRTRRIVSMVLVVLAAIVIALAVTAVWANRTMLNSDRFTGTVTNVTSDQAVLDVLAARITDEAFQAAAGSRVLDQIPPALRPAVPFIVGGLRTRAQDAVEQVLASDVGQSLIKRSVHDAHAAAMHLLEGDGLLSNDAFTVHNGTVTLDLRSIVHQVLVGLQNEGVIPSSVTIPAVGEGSAALASALGITLPADFGQVVVYQTQDASKEGILNTSQRALVVLKQAVVLLVVLGVVLAAAAILVAVDRRRAVFRVGVGIVIALLVLIVVVRRVASSVPNAAATPGGKVVAAALADALRSSLVRALVVVALLSAVVAAIARWWTPLMALAVDHTEVARGVSVAVGLLLLLVLGLGWGALVLAVLVAALGIVAVELATRQAQPSPDG